MNGELMLLTFLLGLGVSFLSGLLGIGGGIVMTPALLYLPVALNIGQLGMHEVAGLTMVQGLLGAASGVMRHHRYGFTHRQLVLTMGSTIAVSSFLGAVASRYVSQEALLAVFALLALIAALLMLLPKEASSEAIESRDLNVNYPLAVLIAASVGVLGGLVGQGGAFILIPLMLHALRLPTRITIGSSLGIVLFSAAAGFLGKLGTGQIDPLLAVALAAGAIPGAQLGAMVSKLTQPKLLRHLLAAVIAITAVDIWYGLLLR